MQGDMLALLRSRRFGPLFFTQLLGAFNDNLFKSALVVALTFGVLAEQASAVGTGALVNLATALLVLPFFLFSATAGQLADRFDKARLIRFFKRTELAVMALAVLGFAVSSVPLLFVSLFLMGTQSAFFGPVKYAVLPQHLEEGQLVRANGLIEMGTFVAILAGTMVGALVVAIPAVGLVVLCAMLVLVAFGGMAAAARVPEAPGSDRVTIDRNPVRATRDTLRVAATDRGIFWAIAGSSWFWLVGAFVLGQMPALALELGAGEGGLTWLLSCFSVGIGLGSVACEKLNHQGRATRMPRVVFIASAAGVAMALALFVLASVTTLAGACLVLFALGAAGGVFIVPLYATMQGRAKRSETSRVIAANNIVNAVFMVAAAGYATWRLGSASLGQVIVEIGVAQLVVSIGALGAVGRDLFRLLFRRTIRAMYRVDAKGFEHIPMEGAGLVICNHESFVDAFVVGGLAPRTMRFIMDHRMAKLPGMKTFFRYSKAIPIAPRSEDVNALSRAMDLVDEALANGELICIFPEGKCTRDGEVDVFKSGVEKILARRRAAGQSVPVVPVGLLGLWGGFFSYFRGFPMKSLRKRAAGRPLRAPLRVRVGAALPSTTSANALRDAVLALRGEQPATSAAAETDRSAPSVERGLEVQRAQVLARR